MGVVFFPAKKINKTVLQRKVQQKSSKRKKGTPSMMQQEEDTEPRRTKEFITRRHSRVVDEKAIMEFYEQYSPLATKIKRRGVESSIENRENANPNSPVLSNSPRPTKRRSIAKATGKFNTSFKRYIKKSKLDIEGLEKEEPSDLFKAGEHQIPPKSGKTPV